MRISIMFMVTVLVMLPVTAQAIQVSGDQWGTWTPDNNPYNVVGEIHVPGESTLVIDPGVLVNFQGHYKFVVDSLATLQAIGTVSDSIYFTTPDTATGWHGVRLLYANENSQISYCHLAYGKAVGGSEKDRSGGAIYCYNCSPTINHNTIRDNYAYTKGGGVSCENHTGVIEYNNICDNLSGLLGGGIYSTGSIYGLGPRIRNNTICRNSANKGAGIFCFRETIIEGNVIESNYTHSSLPRGAGIYASYIDNVITNNRICYNECPYAGYGGGILCEKETIIAGNYIYRNKAGEANDGSRGGGIYCGSLDLLENNTIADNRAHDYDGIQFGIGSTPTISNCIIMDDFGGFSDITVEYSCIEGGWPGVGNINDDPLFQGNYTLKGRSPCIDAGDPASLVPEHGGDRIDMGAYEYFQQYNGYLLFEEYPDVAEMGSVISWEVSLENPTPHPQTIDGWIDFSGPISGTAKIERNKTVKPGIWTDTVGFRIPEDVPLGIYTVKGRVGHYYGSILDSEVFDVEIMEGPLNK